MGWPIMKALRAAMAPTYPSDDAIIAAQDVIARASARSANQIIQPGETFTSFSFHTLDGCSVRIWTTTERLP